MDETEAERLLVAAVARRDEAIAAADQARMDLYQVIRRVRPRMRQGRVVELTGYKREYVRRIEKGIVGGVQAAETSPG